ncbi:MAG TPA: DUF481 domain-containing protein [Candidatus Acidoferrum sp.]|nr:DUF481 domain-containing protein [Candidatus Acidoferrum sp.]
MTKRIFQWLGPVILAASSHAADTNAIAEASTNQPALPVSPSGATPTSADTATNSRLAAVIATNQPVWESSFAGGFTLTKGNSDTLLTTAAFRTRVKTPVFEFGFGLDGSYGESDSVKNNETLHGITQYNHLFSDHWYGYLNAEGLHDGIADLQYRFTVGPGAGYYFLKRTNVTLAAEFGPSLIFQRLGGTDTTYASLRWAERFEQKLKSGARVWEKAEILPQVNKLENYLVNAEMGAEATLTKSLSLRVTLLDNFVHQPAPDRKNNDVKLISGLVYKF